MRSRLRLAEGPRTLAVSRFVGEFRKRWSAVHLPSTAAFHEPKNDEK
jgi:hypothetical protein